MNGMPWLPEAMESLQGQTTTAFEILVIVDGGTDKSLDYLRSLAGSRPINAEHQHGRLRVLEQPNAGVTTTLNRLLSECRTPWLVRQDADDISYPARMERLLKTIRKHPDAGLIYSLANYHPRGRCAGKFRCSRGTPAELRAIVESGYLLSICHSTVALNVEKTRAVGGYRMNLHAEDADLWWRMARRYEILFIPEALVGFRLDEKSVSSRNFEKQQLAGIYVQYLLLSELWGRRPRPWSEVAGVLAELGRPSGTAAKNWLRRANMHLAEGRRLRGVAALARAAWESPRYVMHRVWDEMGLATIANGVAPGLFLERKELLW
jgi:glycosyltransferase involved in cell wall biosynthesis